MTLALYWEPCEAMHYAATVRVLKSAAVSDDVSHCLAVADKPDLESVIGDVF